MCVLESPFNRLAGFKSANFLKKGLQHRYLPVNIATFLRTLILMKIFGQRLLQFLLLTVNISSWVLVSPLNSIGLFQRSSSRFRVLLRVLSGRLLSYLKKRKISWNCHSLSFVVTCCTTRCHFLSLVVILCHLLPLIVTCCHSLYH